MYTINSPDVLVLSQRAQAAVARLVEATIESESQPDDLSALTAVRGTLVRTTARLAINAVRADLIGRAPLAGGRIDSDWLGHYAQTVLRALVNNGLAERICQCKLAFPLGCPHGAAVGSRWCGDHFRASVEPVFDARLCPTCYARASEVAR